MEHKEVNLPATTLRQFTSDLSQGCLIPKPVYRKLFFFFFLLLLPITNFLSRARVKLEIDQIFV
jgi:hypothetical protein